MFFYLSLYVALAFHSAWWRKLTLVLLSFWVGHVHVVGLSHHGRLSSFFLFYIFLSSAGLTRSWAIVLSLILIRIIVSLKDMMPPMRKLNLGGKKDVAGDHNNHNNGKKREEFGITKSGSSSGGMYIIDAGKSAKTGYTPRSDR
jgi:hypothetical protein